MFNFLISKRFFTCFIFLILLTANSNYLFAHEGESHTKKGLHFSHPLISESPSPDTKIRLDYFFMDIEVEGAEEEGGGFKEHTIRLEAEYAFSRNISIEIDAPYTFINPDEGTGVDHFNNIEVGLKLATYIFEQYGLLLGGGIEFGIPTGDDQKGIGSDHILEIEPFLSMGYKYQNFEIVSFVSLGFPVNQDDGEDESDEFGYNVSLLYHLTNGIEALLEIDGEVALNGEEDGESILNIDPGIKILPFNNKDIHIGFGAGFPLTEDEAFEYRLIGSLIYHF